MFRRVVTTTAVAGAVLIVLLACTTPTGGEDKSSDIGRALVSASTFPTTAAPTTAAPTATAVTTAAPTATPAATTAAPTATPAPTTAAPTATPTAAATTAAPTQAPTQAPTVAPTPTPAPTPAPTPTPFVAFPGVVFLPNASGPVPSGFTRFGATVTDAATGAPVVGACVYTGPPAGCPPRGVQQTDVYGFFAVDLPTGITFAFTIEHPLYNAIISRQLAGGTSTSLTMTKK